MISLLVICMTVYNVYAHICCSEVIYMYQCHLTYTNTFISYALDQPFSGKHVRDQKKAKDKIIDSVNICQTVSLLTCLVWLCYKQKKKKIKHKFITYLQWERASLSRRLFHYISIYLYQPTQAYFICSYHISI